MPSINCWEENQVKIRDGFVTNSSSTNFMIICKEELTAEYLSKKLGFKNSSFIKSLGDSLSRQIISGTHRGVRWFEIDEINYSSILEIFGEESAEKYRELTKKGFHTYIGYTSSDDDCFSSFLTMDCFIIDEKDFYMDGKNCVW